MKFCRNLIPVFLFFLISLSLCGQLQANSAISSANSANSASSVRSATTASSESKAGQKNPEQAVLLVGFGSTRPEAAAEYQKGLDSLESRVTKIYPSLKVFHSSSSRNFLQSEQGRRQGAQSTEQVLATLATQGYKRVFVQSLHVTPGSEYNDLLEIASAFSSMPKGLERIEISGPLISSAAAAENLAKVLAVEEKARNGEAVVFVGHGGKKASDLSLLALQGALWRGNPAYLVHGLESKPDFTELEAGLKRLGVKEVRLVPLMAVAGEHVLNDIGGLKDKKDDAGSLFMRLEKLGYKCSVVTHGLLTRPAVLRLWCDKLAAVINEGAAE